MSYKVYLWSGHSRRFIFRHSFSSWCLRINLLHQTFHDCEVTAVCDVTAGRVFLVPQVKTLLLCCVVLCFCVCVVFLCVCWGLNPSRQTQVGNCPIKAVTAELIAAGGAQVNIKCYHRVSHAASCSAELWTAETWIRPRPSGQTGEQTDAP